MDTDRIEKKVLLKASLGRVWRALTDSGEFGSWFGVRFAGPFVVGGTVRGVIVPTTVNAEVAAAQKPYEGTAFEITVERMEAERLFSFPLASVCGGAGRGLFGGADYAGRVCARGGGGWGDADGYGVRVRCDSTGAAG